MTSWTKELLVIAYLSDVSKHLKPVEIIRLIVAFCIIDEDLLFRLKQYQFQQTELYSIGNNDSGQQGNGTYGGSIQIITKIKIFKKIMKNIISGETNVYIIFNDGTYECCGMNDEGQLGIGNFSNPNALYLSNDINIKNIFTNHSSSNSFCISDGNKLYATGRNKWNQFGIKTNNETNNKWIAINTLGNINKIATTFSGTTFLSESGTIICSDRNSETIKEIQTKTTFADISSGGRHTLAIDSNNCIYCNDTGQLGHGDNRIYTPNRDDTPTIIKYFFDNNLKVNKIACGRWHSLVLSVCNKIYCFGDNYYYQCGNGGARQPNPTPQPNPTLQHKNIIDIKCGVYHNLIKTKENEYYLWGGNDDNQCLYIPKADSSKIPKHIMKPLLFNSNYLGIIKR
eukprot:113743_1